MNKTNAIQEFIVRTLFRGSILVPLPPRYERILLTEKYDTIPVVIAGSGDVLYVRRAQIKAYRNEIISHKRARQIIERYGKKNRSNNQYRQHRDPRITGGPLGY